MSNFSQPKKKVPQTPFNWPFSRQEKWDWLEDKPMSVDEINRRLWRVSVSSGSFYILLGLSCMIATLGLLANSVAVIIGAMIIAPLMGPILGISFATVMGNRRLFKEALISLAIGIPLVIILAGITASLLGLQQLNSEILGRTQPSFLDLLVALAAGAAGGYANSRSHIADAIPGVAIAVALVPPLGVVGICLSLQQNNLALGALLLFATNLFGIIFSSGVVFLWQSYGSWSRAKQGLGFAITVLLILAIPLGIETRYLILQQKIRQNITQLVEDRLSDYAIVDLRSINLRHRGNTLFVRLEVATNLNSLSQENIDTVRKHLEEQLNRNVVLNVFIMPIQLIESQKTQ